MKTTKFLFVAISMIMVLLVTHNLIGGTRTITNTKWIVPAIIVDGDTMPVINYPVIIINGNAQ
jgi:hypothetical protein